MSPADQRRLRAEALVKRPGLIGATGDKRDAVLELRAEAEAALTDADARLRAAADDRLTAAARIRACNRALVGTGQVIDRRTGAPAQYLLRRSDAFEDPLPDPAELEVLGSEEVREAVFDLLCLLRRPASVGELIKLLAAHGFAPTGRPSQSISNALRADVRDGRVVRTARGRYQAS